MGILKIGITLGDLNGIGPEVTIKALTFTSGLKFAPIIYASNKALAFYNNYFNLEKLNYNIIQEPNEAKANTINVINCWQEEIVITPGQKTDISGRCAVLALKKMMEDAQAKKLDAVVTGPINKEAVFSNDFPYRGHTEYFAALFNQKPLMLLVDDGLRIGVVTGHIPLSEVASKITKAQILETIKIFQKSLILDFGIDAPKIAILGLNPHAGDSGVIGEDENTKIIPAIREAMNQKIFCFGPYPADGFFGSKEFMKFDGVLAMYHDQGLIPFKTLAFETGVNFSAGLPIVRTSPDHGTAYDIVGHDVANSSSMLHAIRMAYDIVRYRQEFAEDHANPLVKKERNFEDEIVRDEQ